VDNTTLIVIAALAVVAIVAIVFWTSQRRRSDELRRRFGPEYERAVGSARNKREAEGELRARQERVDALDIRQLDRAQRDGYVERWREVQAMFVDDPGNAVDQADKLIGELMRARGYPVGDFEQRAADISVNHPQVVDHYRTAHSIAIKRQSGDSATEQLRQAFVHYRALFADLLEVSDTKGEAVSEQASRPAEPAEPAEAAVREPSAEEDRVASATAMRAPAAQREPIAQSGPAPEAATTPEADVPAETRSAR
jgi:hypothetical protein